MPNFHPMLVHFPIALLTVYALMELLRFKRLRDWQPWFYLKAILVILGALSTIATAWAGLWVLPEFAVGERATAILNLHMRFAFMTSGIFLLIAFFYALAWRDQFKSTAWSKRALCTVKHWSITLLALLGLVLVTITGALGGGFVHGSEVDPFVGLIFKLFGL